MKSIALRLAAEGGKTVEEDFDRIGRSGETALKRVEAAVRPASNQLKLFTDALAKAGESSNLSQQLDGLFGAGGGTQARDRAADVAAYGAELDSLRAKFNPLFAVSQRYEQQLGEIARAEKLGAISAAEAGAARERAAQQMLPTSAATSGAAALGAELDRLREKFNPLFAVSQRYTQELEEIARAEKLGAISTAQAAQARERAAEQMRPMTAATDDLKRSFVGLNSGAVQNASFQVGDFFVQVGSGTSVVVALSQQLPQLLGAFGMWGAVAGAAVAIGGALATSFLSTGDEVESLADRLKDLEEVMNRSRETADILKLSQDELSAKFAGTKEQVAALVSSMQQRDIADLGKSIESFGDGAFSGLTSEIERVRAEFQALGLEFSDGNAFAQMSMSLGLNIEQTEQLVDAMDRFNAAAGSQDRNAIMLETRQMIEGWGLSTEDLPPAMLDFTSGVETASEKISEAAKLMEGLTGATNAAAGATDQLAASMAAAARNAANAHAQFQQMMAAEEAQSKARLAARTEPLANTEDSRVDMSRDATVLPYDVRMWQARQAELAAAKEAAAATREANKARNEAESAAKKEANRLEREEKARQELIAGLEYEKASFDAGELSRRVYSATQRANVDLYSEEGQRIAWLIIQTQGLRDEMQRVDEVNQFVGASLSGLFKGAMEGADGFKNALGDLTGRLADMAIDTAFQSFLDGMNGGGGVGGTAAGGLLTTLFGVGKRAKGGPVRAGQPYVVGEERPELFVPDQAGTILPFVPRGSGGGGAQDVRVSVGVSVDNAGAIQAYVQGVTTRTVEHAMGGARESFRDGVGRAIADPRLKGVR